MELSKKWDDVKLNVAVATGMISNIFVIDIDGEAGQETIQRFETQYGKLPETVTALSLL